MFPAVKDICKDPRIYNFQPSRFLGSHMRNHCSYASDFQSVAQVEPPALYVGCVINVLVNAL